LDASTGSLAVAVGIRARQAMVHQFDREVQYLAIRSTRDAAGAVRSVGSTGDSFDTTPPPRA
jgi:hypothetical protein